MYTQYNEEPVILELLKDEEPRRLLDIGAWDPLCFSNSRALIEQGWGGILIEPSPGPLKNLMRSYTDRRDIEIIGAAVTVEGGLLQLLVTDDAVTMPAADQQRAETWTDTGGFYGRLTVPSISLASIFEQYGGDFQFVSIDTEGTSVDLFAAMIGLGPRPRCVVVEHDNRIVEVTQFAATGNYRVAHLNGTNIIFEWTGAR